MEHRIKADVGIRLNREMGNFTIEKRRIEKGRADELEIAQTQTEADEINHRYTGTTHDSREPARASWRASKTRVRSW